MAETSESGDELPMKNLHETRSGDAERLRLKVLMICLAAGSMTLMDLAMFNVALPSIQSDLNMSPAEVSWSVAGHALALGLVLIPAGRLGDQSGRSILFLIGSSLFAGADIVCGSALDASMLVVGRLCHGVAAGLLAPQVMGLLQQLSRSSKGPTFGYYGATVGLSTAVGPLLGGALLRARGMARRVLFAHPRIACDAVRRMEGAASTSPGTM